jgi:hypothetical protein
MGKMSEKFLHEREFEAMMNDYADDAYYYAKYLEAMEWHK